MRDDSLDTVAGVAAAVLAGRMTRDEAERFLTDVGFADAAGILDDLCR